MLDSAIDEAGRMLDGRAVTVKQVVGILELSRRG